MSPTGTSTTSTQQIPATAMPLISPPALLAAHLSQPRPTRPSQRSPSTPQKIDLNTGSLTHTNGSSVVKIGATTIVCGVRAELLAVSDIANYDTKASNPIATYGLLVPNLELSTGCSPFHAATGAPPTAQAQSLTQRLYSLLLTARVVDQGDLVVRYTPSDDLAVPVQNKIERDSDILPDYSNKAGVDGQGEIKAFWTLYVDLVCLSYGGASSVFDASWLAILAALRDTVLPDAWWDLDLGGVVCDQDRMKGRKLMVQCAPVPLGFAVFTAEQDKSWVLVDPDAFEEQCCGEAGTVVVDFTHGRSAGTVVKIEKSGGGVVGATELRDLLVHAEARWKEWQGIMARVLGKDDV